MPLLLRSVSRSFDRTSSLPCTDDIEAGRFFEPLYKFIRLFRDGIFKTGERARIPDDDPLSFPALDQFNKPREKPVIIRESRSRESNHPCRIGNSYADAFCAKIDTKIFHRSFDVLKISGSNALSLTPFAPMPARVKSASRCSTYSPLWSYPSAIISGCARRMCSMYPLSSPST